MPDITTLIIIALVIGGIIALIWWLFIESEGVYLGRKVVIWLYDVYASRYDGIKHFHPEYDHMFLSQPIMENIAPHKSPLVLDVATGTGRLPLAMLRHAHFQGHVIGVDLSRKMLANAAQKIDDPRVKLILSPAEDLPFPDNTFDVVTCLEAVEFMPDPDAAIKELVRVLRPGGLLLMTNRINTRFLPGKTRPAEEVEAVLNRFGIDDVMQEYWQVDYERIWGVKNGETQPTGARPLAEFFQCPQCHNAYLVESGDHWSCPNDDYRAKIAQDGVIELPI